MSVFPPANFAFRQFTAQAPLAPVKAVACKGFDGQSDRQAGALPHSAPSSLNRNPFPRLRAGNPLSRPVFSGPALPVRQSAADGGITRNFPFQIIADALSCQAIITLNRGSASSCSRKTSLSPFFWQPALPAACQRPRNAVWPVPLSAPQSRMQPTATWSPARPLARLRARPLAASNWACRPANPAIDLTAAPQRRGPAPTPRPFRVATRSGLFAYQSVPARTD